MADWSPGLRDFEACLLRLLEKVTDDCTVEINETGAAQLMHSQADLTCTARYTFV